MNALNPHHKDGLVHVLKETKKRRVRARTLCGIRLRTVAYRENTPPTCSTCVERNDPDWGQGGG